MPRFAWMFHMDFLLVSLRKPQGRGGDGEVNSVSNGSLLPL